MVKAAASPREQSSHRLLCCVPCEDAAGRLPAGQTPPLSFWILPPPDLRNKFLYFINFLVGGIVQQWIKIEMQYSPNTEINSEK